MLNQALMRALAVEAVISDKDLLLHFDDGWVDSGKNALTITAVGSPVLDTSWAAFGTKSGKFDGATNGYLTVPHATLGFGTGDWTVRFRLKKLSASVDGGYFLLMPATGGAYQLVIACYGTSQSNRLRVLYSINNSATLNEVSAFGLPSINTGSVYAISVERFGSNIYVYVNGVRQNASGSANVGSSPMSTPSANIFIGGNSVTANMADSNIDEFMILKGTALAGGASSYTLETSAYT